MCEPPPEIVVFSEPDGTRTISVDGYSMHFDASFVSIGCLQHLLSASEQCGFRKTTAILKIELELRGAASVDWCHVDLCDSVPGVITVQPPSRFEAHMIHPWSEIYYLSRSDASEALRAAEALDDHTLALCARAALRWFEERHVV